MMIRDDDVDSFPCFCHLVNGGYAAIDRNDQRRALCNDFIERFLVQTVTVILAIGNEAACIGSELTKVAAKDRCCRDAVNIVIAINDDALLRLNRLLDT